MRNTGWESENPGSSPILAPELLHDLRQAETLPGINLDETILIRIAGSGRPELGFWAHGPRSSRALCKLAEPAWGGRVEPERPLFIFFYIVEVHV